jgi:hypothetical protein
MARLNDTIQICFDGVKGIAGKLGHPKKNSLHYFIHTTQVF